MDPRASAPPPSAPNPPPSSTAPRPRRWRGALVALVLLAALVGGSWYLINRPPVVPGAPSGGPPGGPGGPGAAAGTRTPSVTVGVATAKQSDIPIQIDALGTVTPVTTVTLRAQVAGTMTEVLFTEGQTVRKGDVLARIDPRPFQQALMQAQGTLARDQAQLEAARVTLARFRTLLGQDSIATQEVDTQAALVQQLEGTVQGDRANVSAAQLNLDYTRVTAPVAGRIGLRTVDPGNYVSSGATEGIAVITQMDPMDVVFAIPQDRVPDILAQVRSGAKLTVSAYDRSRSNVLATGSFSTLDNQVDTTTGTVRAKARFGNANGALFPNQFVNMRMVLRTLSGAVVVPITALRTSNSGNYVYIVNENRTVSQRTVIRGESSVDSVVITEGLRPGETVVTEGGDRLRDGARVNLPGDAAAGPRGGASGARGGASGARGALPAGGASGAARTDAASAPSVGSMSSPPSTPPAPPASAPASAPISAPAADARPAVRSQAAPASGNGDAPAAPAVAAANTGTATAAAFTQPTAAQRERFLSSAPTPEQKERRQRLLAALDRGDPEAQQRWQEIAQRTRERAAARAPGQ